MSNFNRVASPVHAVRAIREHEILRFQADLIADSVANAAHTTRRLVLDWASRKTVGSLPQCAWRFEPFEHMAVGRNCSAVRFQLDDADIWAVRSEDPDKNFADRVWTTEVCISETADRVRISARLLASSRELKPDVDPAVPVIVRQLIERAGLRYSANELSARTSVISSVSEASELIESLVSPNRKLPIVVLTTSSWAADDNKPMMDAEGLAKSLAGLCIVFVLPAAHSRTLTERLGKKLSVYEGAVRIYWPGFTEDSDPFQHDLILPSRLATKEMVASATTRLKWALASYSVRNLTVVPFAKLRSLQTGTIQQSLIARGASDSEQLAAANAQIMALRQELQEAAENMQWLSDEHNEAELRAKHAEEQNGKSGYRIQQLLSQLRETGHKPDEAVALPNDWDSFEDWCDDQLVGRVELTPQARRTLGNAEYESPAVAAKCLLWLANDLRERRVSGGGSVRDVLVSDGIWNSPCGADTYSLSWQGENHDVDWHIKSGGNTRDPNRCLRIYYFWDEDTNQAVIAHLPGHRVTGAS